VAILIGGLAGVPLGTMLVAHARCRHIQIERRHTSLVFRLRFISQAMA